MLREAVLELGGRGLRAERCGKKIACVTLDVDSAPIEVHGHQPKAEWNGHYNARIYHPLITSIAETGALAAALAGRVDLFAEIRGPDDVAADAHPAEEARDHRSFGRGGELGGAAPTFHAVEFFPEAVAAASETPVPYGASQVEIVLVGGRRLVVTETIDPAVLTRLVSVVERA